MAASQSRMDASIKSFVKTYLGICASISVLAIVQTQQQTQALAKIRTRYKWAILMLVFAGNAAAGLYMILRRDADGTFWNRIELDFPELFAGRAAGILLVLAPFPLLWYATNSFFGQGLEAFFRLMWIFWWLALLQAAGFKMATGLSWPVSLGFSVLLDGLVAEGYVLLLPVTDYPFSLGWSEASRFYYGSLWFAKSIYGARLPLSIWHGSRYLLLAVPFLVRGVPIWAARLWQALLWIGITSTSSWLLVRRLRLGQWTTGLVLGAWCFLYLFQGAVYYHLQLSVIIILLGVIPARPLRSLLAVTLASFWAGMSRLNWYPVPAMLAVGLYLLEEPLARSGNLWRYARTAIVWMVSGILSALAGQAFYIAISGNNNLQAFGSSLTSALLWYRWFPSATNPIGIIPGILIVSLPIAAIIAWSLREEPGRLHPLRSIGLLALLLVLLGGGLVVSTKIGGGGDLHNMDAYLVLLAIVGAYFVAGRVGTEAGLDSKFAPALWPAIACMLLVPVGFSILRIGPPFTYDKLRAQADLAALREVVQSYNASGPILFIYERQLLTFGSIQQVRLVPDYEVVSLMEMAISANEPYLDAFYRDLATHRFAAIVAHPQNLGVETGDFIEESNVWNHLVGQPLLCQYKPAITFSYAKVQLLVPRAKPCAEYPPSIGDP